MTDVFDGILARFTHSGEQFARLLRTVTPEQWNAPTPCPDWTVRDLVNHVALANPQYVGLLRGESTPEFLARRGTDVLGDDPIGAFTRTAAEADAAFAEPGAFARTLAHPLGAIPAEQALAVLTNDRLVHTWDLARAIGADETLDPDLVTWAWTHLPEIYAGMSETPGSDDGVWRVFGAPPGELPSDAEVQTRLLHTMGRDATAIAG